MTSPVPSFSSRYTYLLRAALQITKWAGRAILAEGKDRPDNRYLFFRKVEYCTLDTSSDDLDLDEYVQPAEGSRCWAMASIAILPL